MDRVIADGKVVLMMLAWAAYVWFVACVFMAQFATKAGGKILRGKILITLMVFVLGLAAAWLLYLLHVSPYVIIAIAIIGVVVSAFLERKRAAQLGAGR